MSEEKTLTVLQQQKITKPTPEEIVLEFFEGDTQRNALDFVAWLRENKLSPRWDGIYRWKVNYKGKYICYINCSWPITKRVWEVKPNRLFFDEYKKYITDDELKKFILEDVVHLPGCNRECGRKKDIEFLGKRFDEICSCWPFIIKNPEGTALENLKKLILISRNIIDDLNTANKSIKRLIELEQKARDEK